MLAEAATTSLQNPLETARNQEIKTQRMKLYHHRERKIERVYRWWRQEHGLSLDNMRRLLLWSKEKTEDILLSRTQLLLLEPCGENGWDKEEAEEKKSYFSQSTP